MEAQPESKVYVWKEISKEGVTTVHTSSDPDKRFLDKLVIRHSRPCYIDSATETPSPILLTPEDRKKIEETTSKDPIFISTPHPDCGVIGPPLVSGLASYQDTFYQQPTEEWMKTVQTWFVEQLRETIPLCCALAEEVERCVVITTQNMRKLATLDSSSQYHLTTHRLMNEYSRSFQTLEVAVDSLQRANKRAYDYQEAHDALEEEFFTLKENLGPVQNLTSQFDSAKKQRKRIGDLITKLEVIEAELASLDIKSGLVEFQEQVLSATEQFTPSSSSSSSSSSFFPSFVQ